MIWCAVLVLHLSDNSGRVLIQSPDNTLWVSRLATVTSATVGQAVARRADTTPDNVHLRETPRRRKNGMTLWEFVVFDNSPAPF